MKSSENTAKTVLRTLNASEIAPGMRLQYYEHAAMDRAHHKFTALLGALPLVDKAAFSCLLEQIYQEAKEHFEQEERFMLTTEFDQYKAHKAQHDALLLLLDDQRNSLNAGHQPDAVGLQLKLCYWQDKHQQDWDYPLADFLRCRASWLGESAGI
ncbi:hypothetical protein [Oceanospirillum sp.]|uniref:hypothetical protein n=1 Tax=Oceanospirillum sp. TaxID=2021254 RepID=UPI003A918EDB